MSRQDFVWLCFILSETGGEEEGTGRHLQGSGPREDVWSNKKRVAEGFSAYYTVC